MAQIFPAPADFDVNVEVLIVGAGAAGLIAALSAYERDRAVLVLEREAEPAGSTALSAGLIPAAGTRLQKQAGIDDDPTLFAADIQAKAKGENDQSIVELLASQSADVIDWLQDAHGLPFSVVDDFDYPGHSRRRMHGLPTRAGRELVNALRSRCEALDIDIVCQARVETLYREGSRIKGVGLVRPDGSQDSIGCDSLILACNGYGGNRDLVRENMPEIEKALWFGHDGNKGEAVLWGRALGAKLRHLGAYQGHGNVAHPHGILITWAVITEGGFQVNALGERFWNEAQGYSEAARAVLAQPEGIAYSIFDARIASIARQFADFREAEAQSAILTANSLAALARTLGLPEGGVEAAAAELSAEAPDRFGRISTGQALKPPFYAVKVTGALFHTQGGLAIDPLGRVLGRDDKPFENLYAAGGAACGVSGTADAGYLSGNGLLSAAVLGRLAGKNAGG